VGSVLLFGIATAMIGLANGPDVLAVLRLCAGIGLGAAFPNVAALAAEFTPARRRSLAVVITIVCVPLGGVIGGTAASFIMPLLGWRSLFVGAGLVTLAICGIIVLALPESVRFSRGPLTILVGSLPSCAEWASLRRTSCLCRCPREPPVQKCPISRINLGSGFKAGHDTPVDRFLLLADVRLCCLQLASHTLGGRRS
jgi:MFS family permease